MARESDFKKSFKLYNDWSIQFEKLEDGSAGKLIKAIFAYVNGSDPGSLDDVAADMAFSFIRSQIDRDKEAYDRKCETNRRNAKLGGRPKKEAENRTVLEKPNGLQENRTVLNTAGIAPQEAQKPAAVRRREYPKAFEEFWNVYPRKEGKGDCYKKYQARLNDGYSEAELLTAARNYRNVCDKAHTEQRYIKQGKTFLSENTPFLDYLNKEQRTQTEAPRRKPTDNPFG